MTEKNEAFPNFTVLYYIMLNQGGKTIKRFQIDEGREYGMPELDAFCKEKGIILETTAHYTLEQNNILERTNGIVFTRARAMMLDSNLPSHMWLEAVGAAIYLLNCTGNTVLKGVTPCEAFD